MISSCDSYCIRFQTNITIEIYHMIFFSCHNSQDYIYLTKGLINHTALELNSSPVNVYSILTVMCVMRHKYKSWKLLFVYIKMKHTFINCQIRHVFG
jgi:hypothetical protein